MTVFPIFTCVCIFGITYNIIRIRTSKKDKKNEQSFWAREDQANSTQTMDISDLPYINIPIDYLPIGIMDDPELIECENAIRELADKKILNLSNYSNTDLKLKYGAGNINILSECDDNFNTLAHLIIKWATELDRLGFLDEAITVLEYGINWESDLKVNYVLLGQLYCQRGEYSQVDELIATASKLDCKSKDGIIAALNAL